MYGSVRGCKGVSGEHGGTTTVGGGAVAEKPCTDGLLAVGFSYH